MTEIIVEARKLWKPELAVINGYCDILLYSAFDHSFALHTIRLFTRTWLRYVRVFAVAIPSVVCRLSVTLVHPTQGIEAFGNISSLLCTLAIIWPPRSGISSPDELLLLTTTAAIWKFQLNRQLFSALMSDWLLKLLTASPTLVFHSRLKTFSLSQKSFPP